MTAIGTLSIKVKDGDLSWLEVIPLRERVYTSEEASASLIASIEWAHAAQRAMLYADEKLIAVAGLYQRHVLVDDHQVSIAGIGGVMTDPEHQGLGYGKKIVDHALKVARSEGTHAFAFLFCEDHNIAFYRKLGWTIYQGDILVEQNGKSGTFPMRNAMYFPLNEQVNSKARLDLSGLPW